MSRAGLVLVVALLLAAPTAWPQGMPVGPEFRVNTYTTSVQRFPSVAVDSAGNFIVCWTSDTQDGSSWGVYGQRCGQIVPVELMRFGVE